MRKLAQLAVIVAASVLTIMSAVGGADLLGPAHADGPQCIAKRDGSMPAASGPAPGRPAPGGPAAASDCLHGRRAEDRRRALLASASTQGAPMGAIEPAPERNSIELSRWLTPP